VRNNRQRAHQIIRQSNKNKIVSLQTQSIPTALSFASHAMLALGARRDRGQKIPN
jgi:hypothetical protein